MDTELPAAPAAAAAIEPIKAEISIDDFGKVDLRIAKIVSAGFVEAPTSCCN